MFQAETALAVVSAYKHYSPHGNLTTPLATSDLLTSGLHDNRSGRSSDSISSTYSNLRYKRGGVIGGPFPAFRGKFHVFPAFRSFFSFFPAFRHFSLSFGCFPVFRSFSRQLSGFRSFQNQFSVFRRYFKVFRFSVTQKCHFPVSGTLLFSGFPQDFFPFSGFPPLIWCFSGFPP